MSKSLRDTAEDCQGLSDPITQTGLAKKMNRDPSSLNDLLTYPSYPNMDSAIWNKWVSLGGIDGFLGNPINCGMTLDDTIFTLKARHNDFEGGSIYSSDRGVYEIHGIIRDYWLSGSHPTGGSPQPNKERLGFPASDVLQPECNRGYYTIFDPGFRGSRVYYRNGDPSPYEVSNKILEEYLSRKYPNGEPKEPCGPVGHGGWGFPKGEQLVGSPLIQYFEGGTMQLPVA
jgi:hypothetical protein